jgi:hypothetical protein
LIYFDSHYSYLEGSLMKVGFSFFLVALAFSISSAAAQTIDNHPAKYSPDGVLQPWTSFGDALDREMAYYLRCPIEHGYPRFVVMTFMNKDYTGQPARPDFIPAMQNGMGIISYLKYYHYTGEKRPEVLRFARYMGDYFVNESLTPDTGKYPRFPRSTGISERYPQPEDAGSQKDRKYEVQPDKGAIAGYALALLYQETGDQRYLDMAAHVADVLVKNMQPGDATHSPWAFRVDYRTGEGRGPVSADMSFPLRLFDKLIELKHSEFSAPRDQLWKWILDFQIHCIEGGERASGNLWAQFFEDYQVAINRNSWSAMNLARYLLERKEAIDPLWKEHSKTLIDFVNRTFTSVVCGIAVCGEQDTDHKPWGGANSTYAAVLAMYSAETGSPEFKFVAHQAMTFALYAIEDDGHPYGIMGPERKQSWQEDSHTDVVHNVVDALEAFPEWR